MLAVVLEEKGELIPAETLYRQAMEAQVKLLGENHPDTARAFGAFGVFLARKGDYAGAEPFLIKSASAFRKLGDAQNTVTMLKNQAQLRMYQRRFEDAAVVLKDALEIGTRVLGELNPLTIDTLDKLANCHQETSDHIAASEYYRRALAAFTATTGEKSQGAAFALRGLAFNLHRAKRDEEVEALYRRALAIPSETWGPPDQRADALHRFAEFLTDVKRYADAEPFWLELWDWIKAHPQNTAFDLTRAEIAPQVAGLYQAWGKEDLAEKWMREAHAGEPEKKNEQ